VKYSFAQVRKAVAAAVLAAAGVLVASAQKGTLGTNEYISAVVAGLVAGVGVFFIPNAPPTPAVAKTGP
jgi:hypothetical protein